MQVSKGINGWKWEAMSGGFKSEEEAFQHFREFVLELAEVFRNEED